MLQNPPLPPVSWSLTGPMLPHWRRTARRGATLVQDCSTGRHTAPNCDLTDSKRGNCASRGRMRDLLADDCAVKWGELHH